jgi:hypothetical protein
MLKCFLNIGFLVTNFHFRLDYYDLKQIIINYQRNNND